MNQASDVYKAQKFAANVTFRSPEQVYTIHVTLYERLYAAFGLFRYCQGIRIVYAVGKTKESITDAETENESISSFIVYSVRMSRPSLFVVVLNSGYVIEVVPRYTS